MSVERLKNTIAQLERKKSKRRLAASKLQDEHDQLLLNSRAVDLLVQHQDAVTRMLHAYFQPGAEPLPSIADDTGLIQPVLYEWPLMPEFRAMRLADYNWLLGATVQQVRAKVLDHLQDIAQLMRSWHSSNSSSRSSSVNNKDSAAADSSSTISSREQNRAALDEAVSGLLHLTKALYIITPQLVYALKDVNLLTGQQDTPPDSHWERAFCATEASLQQLAVMQQILGHIVPTMEHLEQERQQLAACITSVKALSLHEQSAQAKAAAKLLLLQQQQQQEEQEKQAVQAEPQPEQQQQQQQQQQTQGRVGASRAAGRRAAAVRRVSAAVAATRRAARTRTADAGAAAAAAASKRGRRSAAVAREAHRESTPVGYYMSLLQQAIADEPPAAPQSAVPAAAAAPAAASEAPEVSPKAASVVAADSSSTPDASSSSTGRFMQGMCKDMVTDMDSRLLKWRTLSGARSAVSFVFRSEQLAALLLASFPYLPMTACMCDYVPAARAAALQREQQRQLLLGQL